MRSLVVASLIFTASSASAQATITPSQTRLIGCFGEAFTLVEHVWRVAPKHVTELVAQAKEARTEVRKQFLDGFVSAAVMVDQESAFAVARNLDGCLDEATRSIAADQTTVVLATAVRTELDSALEDVADYAALVSQHRDTLRTALRTPATDARGSAFDVYLTFGDRMREQLTALRKKVDAVITASTP